MKPERVPEELQVTREAQGRGSPHAVLTSFEAPFTAARGTLGTMRFAFWRRNRAERVELEAAAAHAKKKEREAKRDARKKRLKQKRDKKKRRDKLAAMVSPEEETKEDQPRPGLFDIPWKATKDQNSGVTYWYHTGTQETTWDDPVTDLIKQRAVDEFKHVDVDGGGSISVDELDAALRGLGIKMPPSHVKLLIGRYDADASGELEIDEWLELVQDAYQTADGNGDFGASLKLYARRMPIADVKRAKGYPDPPVNVSAHGDTKGAAVWWTPPPERPGMSLITGYVLKKWRKQGDEWCLKGEIEFENDARCSQRVDDIKRLELYRFTVTSLNKVGRSIDSEPSNHVTAHEILPSGWSQHFDNTSNTFYYYNKKTDQRTWQRPEEDPYYIDTNLFLQFTMEEMTRFKELYTELDYDNSAAVSMDELTTILPRIGERLSDRDVEYLFFKCDEDESNELDYEEFVNMLLFLKQERMKRVDCWKANRRRWKKFWAKKPIKLKKKQVQNLEYTKDKKMGAWTKYWHPVVRRPYYFNVVSKETRWTMPDEIKYFLDREMAAALMEKFSLQEIQEWEDRFSSMDLDDSGAIDRDELRVILQSMGENVSKVRLDALISEIDRDNSGEIEFDEFCLMMSVLKDKKNVGARSSSWGRINNKFENKNTALVGEMKKSYLKLKGTRKQKQRKKVKQKQIKNPHGEYCMCGCREFNPLFPAPKSCWYYLCCFGCICCCCCNKCLCCRTPEHMFPPISKKDMEKKRRRMRLAEEDGA